MNSVGDNGYTVIKEELTNAEITKIRKDLTVKPFVNGSFGVEAAPFAIYMEIYCLIRFLQILTAVIIRFKLAHPA